MFEKTAYVRDPHPSQTHEPRPSCCKCQELKQRWTVCVDSSQNVSLSITPSQSALSLSASSKKRRQTKLPKVAGLLGIASSIALQICKSKNNLVIHTYFYSNGPTVLFCTLQLTILRRRPSPPEHPYVVHYRACAIIRACCNWLLRTVVFIHNVSCNFLIWRKPLNIPISLFIV
jgi:hypothetical protein